MRMSAYDRWATQGPPEWDEERALEHEAREQVEADAMRELVDAGECLECCGAGIIITGWQACGLAPIYETCPQCNGTGEGEPRYCLHDKYKGCPACDQSGHDIQACPAIREELMR